MGCCARAAAVRYQHEESNTLAEENRKKRKYKSGSDSWKRWEQTPSYTFI